MGSSEVKDPAVPPETGRSNGSGGRSAAARRARTRVRRQLELVGLLPGSPDGDLYHGFISYSHAADGGLAPALQKGLQRFAKPWFQARALHVFRDDAVLSANPHLWTSISEALDRSQFFILLASPDAASSPWVAREAERWRETKTSQRLLVGLTDGDLVWDQHAGDFDWRRTNALPETLRGAFDEEPRYIDLRWARNSDHLALSHPQFRDAVAELAAPLHGKPKDELASEEVRQHRRAVRLARAAVGALATLLVIAVIAGVVALNQRSAAIRQADLATSRALAATSENQLGTNLDVALLLAVQAYRKNPNPQTRSALVRANAFSPHLVRYVPMGARVYRLAGSGDGRTAATSLVDGRVMRWSVARPTPTQVMKLGGPAASLAVSTDGTAVAAADGHRAMLWRQGRRPLPLAVPAGQRADVVALAPSGGTVVVHGGPPAFGAGGSIVTFDAVTGATRSTHPDPVRPGGTSAIVAATDDQVLLLNQAYGLWVRRRLADWKGTGGSTGSLGAHELPALPSSDGRRMTATNGNPTILAWSIGRGSSHNAAEFTAQAPISGPTSIALSPNGSSLAVADSGAIYVAPVAKAGAARGPAVQLTGEGSINVDGVRFLGDGSHLLSASRDKVEVWDLGQLDRLARTSATPVPGACNACDGARVTVAPGGGRAVIEDSSGGGAVIQPLDGRGRPQKVAGNSFDYSFGPPVWERSGSRVALPVQSSTGGANARPPTGLPSAVHAWRAGNGTDPVAAAGLSSDGRRVNVVDVRARVYQQDVATGAIHGPTTAPAGLVLRGSDPVTAAVHSSPDVAAVLDLGAAAVVDLRGRRVVARIPGRDVGFVTYGGPHLLVQRQDGTLEVWDQWGRRRERVLPGDTSFFYAPVASPDGRLVARRRTDGSVVLDDLTNGTVLGTFASPGPGWVKTGVGFSPDGRRLISVTDNPAVGPATLVQRDLSDEGLTRTACVTAGRDLTAAEWRAFVGTAPPGDLACR